MAILKFTDIFPEYKDISHWDYYQYPEYTVYRYLILEGKTLPRLIRIKALLTAPDTFYAKDILAEENSRGGIINGFCQSELITETGNKVKYYIDIDDKKAVITYAKEWKLTIPKDRMILAYDRIRDEILKII